MNPPRSNPRYFTTRASQWKLFVWLGKQRSCVKRWMEVYKPRRYSSIASFHSNVFHNPSDNLSKDLSNTSFIYSSGLIRLSHRPTVNSHQASQQITSAHQTPNRSHTLSHHRYFARCRPVTALWTSLPNHQQKRSRSRKHRTKPPPTPTQIRQAPRTSATRSTFIRALHILLKRK